MRRGAKGNVQVALKITLVPDPRGNVGVTISMHTSRNENRYAGTNIRAHGNDAATALETLRSANVSS